jgi:endogenous inhibitor of DNA gyrase (YacG/DUF329 family)
MWINAARSILCQTRNMSYDRLAPRCPNCGKPMQQTNTIPKLGGLPELVTFACRECGEVVTEAARVDFLARAAL